MHGIHTAVITPFSPSGSVDLSAFARLCERQIEQGIHGLVACGTTGETPTLSQGEWAAVVRTAVEVSAGRVPVTAGVGTNNTKTTIDHIDRALELGADAGLLVFPYYNKPNRSGHIAHIEAAAKPGLPLMLYHVPGRTGQRLSAALLCELAGLDGVIAVKEATGDLLFGGQVLTQTEVPVLSGDDFTFLSLLAMGGAGCVSVVSNVAPAKTVAIYESFLAGDVTSARRHLHELWPMITYLFADTNPVPCKRLLAELGLCHDAVRPPLGPSDQPLFDVRSVVAE